MAGNRFQSLIPILPMQPGVCSICHQWTMNESRVCETCTAGCLTLGMEANELGRLRIRGTTDGLATVLPIFLRFGPNSGPYAAGYEYKWNAEDLSKQKRIMEARQFIHAMTVAALQHERCVSRHISMETSLFDVVTWVPTKQGKSEPHAMSKILLTTEAASRLRSILTYALESPTAHLAATDMWSVAAVDGRVPQSVLVVDDTWTVGASMLSAAYALLKAGVRRVGLVALGRHISPLGYNRSPDTFFERFSAEQTWSENHCAFCDSRAGMRAQPSLVDRYERLLAEVMPIETPAIQIVEAREGSADDPVVGRRMLSTAYGLGQVEEVEGDMLMVQFGVYGLRKINIMKDDFEWL